MENINTPDDLLSYEVEQLKNAVAQMLGALPFFAKYSEHTTVKNAFKHYTEVMQEQQGRLQNLLQSFSKEKIAMEASERMSAIIRDAQTVLNTGVNNELSDMVIIASVQKMQEYKISCCHVAYYYATKAGNVKARNVLQSILDEEDNEADLFDQLIEVFAGHNALEEKEKIIMPGKLSKNRRHKKVHDAEEDTYRSSSSTHDIQSPGGRGGVSHRRYADGESRGH